MKIISPLINEYEKSIYLDIFVCLGRKGAVISKLRDEHGVNIQVPPSGSTEDEEKSNQIRIIGYEQNCMEAKEAILAIIGELVSFLSYTSSQNNRYRWITIILLHGEGGDLNVGRLYVHNTISISITASTNFYKF